MCPSRARSCTLGPPSEEKAIVPSAFPIPPLVTGQLLEEAMSWGREAAALLASLLGKQLGMGSRRARLAVQAPAK